MTDPVFIIGTERSGTNLLRNMLGAHSEFATPHPPHIYENFRNVISMYGDLTCEKNLKKCTRDIVYFTNLHFNPWPFILYEDDVLRRIRLPTLFGIKAAVYDVYAEYVNKPRWICKSTFMLKYTDQILEVHPNAKFIHLIRNPIDVCSSMLHTPLGHRAVQLPAKRWAEDQRIISDLTRYGIYKVTYEELVDNSLNTMKSVSEYLNVNFEEQMLLPETVAGVSDEAKKIPLLSNTSKPIIKSTSNRYKSKLSFYQHQRIIEICNSEMTKHGYDINIEYCGSKRTSIRDIIRDNLLFNKVTRKINWLFAWRNFYYMRKHTRRKLFINRLKVKARLMRYISNDC